MRALNFFFPRLDLTDYGPFFFPFEQVTMTTVQYSTAVSRTRNTWKGEKRIFSCHQGIIPFALLRTGEGGRVVRKEQVLNKGNRIIYKF